MTSFSVCRVWGLFFAVLSLITARGYAQDFEADGVDIRMPLHELMQTDEGIVDEGALVAEYGNPGEVSVTATIDDRALENWFEERELERLLEDLEIYLNEEQIGPWSDSPRIRRPASPSPPAVPPLEWRVWEIDVLNEEQIGHWSDSPRIRRPPRPSPPVVQPSPPVVPPGPPVVPPSPPVVPPRERRIWDIDVPNGEYEHWSAPPRFRFFRHADL
jgi:hypothetical protein